LLALEAVPDLIEFRGDEPFTLQRQPDRSWRVVGQPFPADPASVDELLTTLTNLVITNFVQDVVIDPDLPKFGLATPSREIRLFKTAASSSGPTNIPIASLAFGSRQAGGIFVRRADEDSVYEVGLAAYERLPASPLQLRDRRIWNFTEDGVTRVTTAQDGRTRTVLRLGTNSWSLAPGSQGEIFSEAIEETVHRLGELSVLAWVGCGETNLAQFGFSTNSLSLAIELKNGKTNSVAFGGPSPGGYPCASLLLDGEPWIGEIPIGLHYLVRTHLGLTGNER